MKKLIAFVFLFQSWALSAQNTYLIKGQIKGVEDGTEIKLYQSDGSSFRPINSDTIKSGNFQFKGQTTEPKQLMLMSRGSGFPSQWLDVWVAPNTSVKITGTNKLLKTWNVQSPIKEQKVLNRYTAATKSQLDQLQLLGVARNVFFTSPQPSSLEEGQKFKRSIDSIDWLQDSLYNIVHAKEIEILNISPVSEIWIDKLKGIAMTSKYKNNESLRKSAILLYNKLNITQRQTDAGYEITAYLYPPKVAKKGELMADTVFRNLAGEQRSLSGFKGKYILLDFWSIGCGPCLAAMPDLKLASEKYRDSLAVVSLTMDTKKTVWQNASEKHGITWENLSDGKGMAGIAARYGVSGIPHYVMISPAGVILDSWVGFGKGQLEEKIKKYIR